jgi:transcriptional regulator with XRE-family HTH domain
MSRVGVERNALRHFLRSRRARLRPDDAGLMAGGRRHTQGLRREEVAVLAGVSASWYTWLEQGRDIRVSDSILDSISGALRLDETERVHLYRLAGINPPQVRPDLPDDSGRLQMVVDGCRRRRRSSSTSAGTWRPTANGAARSLLGVSNQDNYL